MATEYTPAEIAFFKAVVRVRTRAFVGARPAHAGVFCQVDQIMLAPHESYCVSSLVALREVSFIQPTITKTHAEKVLTSLVARGWLVKSR